MVGSRLRRNNVGGTAARRKKAGKAPKRTAATRATPARRARPAARATVIRRPASVGISVPRLEGVDKVTGRARYVDDLVVPGVLYGRTVRSAVARGRITRISLDPAFNWSGVVVTDHRDIPGENVVALIDDDQPLLAADEVRHADEPIVLVAHEDPERAQAAVQAVRVEIEPLPPVLTVEEALAAHTKIHGDDNIFKTIAFARGDAASVLAAADLVVEGTYHTGHQEQLYIENNGMIAERTAGGGVRVRGSLQCPYYVHKALKRIFALTDERVRVVQTVTGGGFGGKEEYPSMIAGHAALLAWKSGRPVKIVYDRLEDIAATTKRHPSVVRIRTAVGRDGTLLAHEIDIVMDGGAYSTLSAVVLSRGAIHCAGPYRAGAVAVRARAVATHTPPNGAFRGFGAPQTEFAMECHMNRIAARLGMDPLALRRKNAYREGDVTPTGQVMRESVGALATLEAGAKHADWAASRARIERENAAAAAAEALWADVPGRAHRARPGMRAPIRRVRRGLGLAFAYHGAGFTGSGEVRLASLTALDLAPDGRPRVLAASTEIGQGTNTMFAQIVAEGLGVTPSFVTVETPDTGLVPDSGPTVASRTCMVVGGMLGKCATRMRERLELFAERPIRDDADFRRIARRYLAERGPLRIEQRYEPPPNIAWDDDTYYGDAYGVFSYACVVAEVEVDLDTAETRVLRLASTQDIGTVIHPVLAAGQVEGGIVQALGYALLEEVRWKDGRVWNHQLTNYIIPTSADTPPIDVVFVEVPYAHGPFGAKGVGELPMDAPAPAIVAAIAHATGRYVDEIPVTPERLLEALRAGETR